MSKTIKILVSIFAVQAAVFLFLYTKKAEMGTFQGGEALLALDFDSIDALAIEDNEKNVLELKKVNGKWTLPKTASFQVSEEKFKTLSTTLKELKRNWPVGKTQLSAKQFDVVEEQFEKKISFFKGATVVKTLFLGSSPSFKKIHLRVDGEDLTYSAALNTYDIPTAYTDWMDKDFLKVPKDKIAEIKLGSLKLHNNGGVFRLGDLAENEEMLADVVNPLVDFASKPVFEDVLVGGAFDASKVAIEFELKTTQNESLKYAFSEYSEVVQEKTKDSEEKKESFYKLKVSNYPFVYKFKKDKLSKFVNLERASLVKQKEVTEQGASKSDHGAAVPAKDVNEEHASKASELDQKKMAKAKTAK